MYRKECDLFVIMMRCVDARDSKRDNFRRRRAVETSSSLKQDALVKLNVWESYVNAEVIAMILTITFTYARGPFY